MDFIIPSFVATDQIKCHCLILRLYSVKKILVKFSNLKLMFEPHAAASETLGFSMLKCAFSHIEENLSLSFLTFTSNTKSS